MPVRGTATSLRLVGAELDALGTTDKRQAQELHDQLKAEAWRVDKMGEFKPRTFDEACVRWLNEKQHKKSLDDD